MLALGAEAATTGTSLMAGQKINFGNYWQSYIGSGDKSDKANYNKDPITWRVLANNRNNTFTLLSDKCLYTDAFHSYNNEWSNSEIKQTLNNTSVGSGFAGDAFTVAEYSFIVNKNYDIIDKRGNEHPTSSKLYLLDVRDVKDGGTYSAVFSGNGSRIAKATDFACNVKVYGNSGTIGSAGNCEWWLRSPSIELDQNATSVNGGGDIDFDGWRVYRNDRLTVRPAMDIKLGNILYTSVATGGKSSAVAGKAVKFGNIANNSIVDVTLKDTSNTYTSAVTMGNSLTLNGSKIGVDFNGGNLTDNQHLVTALFVDNSAQADNKICGYGVFAQGGATAPVSGEADISALDTGKEYQMLVQNEYHVGDGSIYFTGDSVTFAGTFSNNNSNVKYKVSDGENWDKITIYNNSLLEVVGHCSINNFRCYNGGTLIVDGNKIQATAAITTNFNSLNVENNAKLIVKNQKAGINYKIFDKANPPLLTATLPSTSTPAPSNNIDLDKIVWPEYGMVVDSDNSTFNDDELTVGFTEDPKLSDYSDLSNIVGGLLNDAETLAWLEEISYDLMGLPNLDEYLETVNNAVNTLGNMNSLANVQGGVNTISTLATNSIQNNISTMGRPMLNSGNKNTVIRNVAATGKDNITKIETIQTAKTEEIMPSQYEADKYEKDVWASFIHNKEKINGRKTGYLKQNSTMQYNGIIVGADLWSGKHGFGGIALTYGDGNFNSSQMISNVKNEVDYYGINIYNRQDIGKFSLQYDGGFTYGKNDVTVSTWGEEDITANPKVRAYNMGFKVENPIKISGATELTPFAGARYSFVKTKKYQNSLGLGYDIKNQHLFNIPAGVTIKGTYQTKEGWKLGGSLSGGYSWNLGNRNGRQKVSFGGYSDMIDFDIVDKGEYFIHTAVQAEKGNLSCEVGHNYSKGKTTRSNKWYVNVGISF